MISYKITKSQGYTIVTVFIQNAWIVKDKQTTLSKLGWQSVLILPYAGANLELMQAIGMYEEHPYAS